MADVHEKRAGFLHHVLQLVYALFNFLLSALVRALVRPFQWDQQILMRTTKDMGTTKDWTQAVFPDEKDEKVQEAIYGDVIESAARGIQTQSDFTVLPSVFAECIAATMTPDIRTASALRTLETILAPGAASASTPLRSTGSSLAVGPILSVRAPETTRTLGSWISLTSICASGPHSTLTSTRASHSPVALGSILAVLTSVPQIPVASSDSKKQVPAYGPIRILLEASPRDLQVLKSVYKLYEQQAYIPDEGPIGSSKSLEAAVGAYTYPVISTKTEADSALLHSQLDLVCDKELSPSPKSGDVVLSKVSASGKLIATELSVCSLESVSAGYMHVTKLEDSAVLPPTVARDLVASVTSGASPVSKWEPKDTAQCDDGIGTLQAAFVFAFSQPDLITSTHEKSCRQKGPLVFAEFSSGCLSAIRMKAGKMCCFASPGSEEELQFEIVDQAVEGGVSQDWEIEMFQASEEQESDFSQKDDRLQDENARKHNSKISRLLTKILRGKRKLFHLSKVELAKIRNLLRDHIQFRLPSNIRTARAGGGLVDAEDEQESLHQSQSGDDGARKVDAVRAGEYHSNAPEPEFF